MDLNYQEQSIAPFLKWAGGKRWLVQSEELFLPASYKRYIEPFLGSGAVFFSLNQKPFIIGDANRELINCYRALRDNPEKVSKALSIHQRKHSHDYYYRVRSSEPRTDHTKAARFIYLNRTCFNGLYRVNLKGEFNVPKGSKEKVLLESDDFDKVSSILRDGQILNQDFEKTIELAESGDFIFVDPPYTVKHNMNGFVKYNEKIFSWDDQVRLRNAICSAVDKGVKITLTNADHASIYELYDGLGRIEKISRNSVIAGTSQHRGKTTEVLIKFGWKK